MTLICIALFLLGCATGAFTSAWLLALVGLIRRAATPAQDATK